MAHGWIVKRTGEYYWAFVVAAAVVLAAAGIFVFGIECVEPVRWPRHPVASLSSAKS